MPTKTLTSERTLADVAAQRLAHGIVTGELLQVLQLKAAERFGIGRGPVREALRHLEGMRLVTRIRNAGARVVVLVRKSLGNLYAVREALEGMVCRFAASLMTPDEVARLNAFLNGHEAQIGKHGGKEYAQTEGDFDFHDQSARGSGHRTLMAMLGSERNQMLHMCRYHTRRIEQRTLPALQQHLQIVAALAQRDGELAEMLMRRHVQGAWRSISEMIALEEPK